MFFFRSDLASAFMWVSSSAWPSDWDIDPAHTHVDDERVEEAEVAPLAASDPPSWTSGVERHPDLSGPVRRRGRHPIAGRRDLGVR